MTKSCGSCKLRCGSGSGKIRDFSNVNPSRRFQTVASSEKSRKFTDEGVTALAKVKTLELIDFFLTSVSEKCKEDLRKALPKCSGKARKVGDGSEPSTGHSMISPERLSAMQGQWVRLLGGFGVPVADAYAPFDKLVAAYSEPHRHYHTLEHLGDMFRVVGRLAGVITDMPAVQFAVWYHDAVYDPKASDNEEPSAEWAEVELKIWGITDSTRAAVRALILATKHTAIVPDTSDAAAFLDADLAILGATEARYARYAADIRKEYDWVPEEQYCAGRRAVLQGFLTRERIYRTTVMVEEGEEAARRNLAAEIERLTSLAT